MDTVIMPRSATVRLARMPDNRPGKCHILEHAAAGMMAYFELK